MNVAIKILEKKALKKLSKDKVDTNSENPYCEKVPVYKNGKIAKYQTQERPIPAGLSSNDAKILRKVRRRAYRWDMGFRLCCFNIRFGWSSVIGLIPVIGDFADFLIALSLIKKASNVDGGLPKRLYGMMLTNIMIDLAVGFIPLIGDFADMLYRANTKNAWLLDAYLTEKAKALETGVVQDPETGSVVEVPPSLGGADDDRDVETGVATRAGTMASVATPARSARQAGGPAGNTAAAPQSVPVAPVRTLTPPRAPIGGGLPGRQITPNAGSKR